MKIFTSSQVQEIDRYTIENESIASIDLMERASQAFAFRFMKYFDLSHKIVVFAGPGNNGGDALAIARILCKSNYKVDVYFMRFSDSISPDCSINYERLKKLPGINMYDLAEKDMLPDIGPGKVIIDGIFGSGLSRPVTGFPARIIDLINHSGAKVVSIDIPSGLFGEDNRNNIPDAIVNADFTISFQFPFLSFFFAENYKYTGDWSVVPIGLNSGKIASMETDHNFLTGSFIRDKIKPRSKFSHKGNYGHALLLAGSYKMMGAAVISAKACLRGGAGLVTAHVPLSGYQIMQTAVPEAIVSVDTSERIISSVPGLESYNAIGVGPGISAEAGKGTLLFDLLSRVRVPLVIDADGLNSLSGHKEWFVKIPKNTILTPHPKEFDRLAGESKGMYDRHMKQIEFAKKYNVIVVLKGAHTIITLPDGSSWFNTSGNPGMASGGSGDVLTGLIVSLLAQSYEPGDAAMLGVYIHGLAGDIAAEKISQPALIAGDIIDNIGKAFLKLNSRESL